MWYPAVINVVLLKTECFVQEMEIMKMIGRHVNIINMLGVCTQPTGQPLLVGPFSTIHTSVQSAEHRFAGDCRVC